MYRLIILFACALLSGCLATASKSPTIKTDEILFNQVSTWSVSDSLDEKFISTKTNDVTFVYFLEQSLITGDRKDDFGILRAQAKDMLEMDSSHVVYFVGLNPTGSQIDSNAKKQLAVLFPDIKLSLDKQNIKPSVLIVSLKLKDPTLFRYILRAHKTGEQMLSMKRDQLNSLMSKASSKASMQVYDWASEDKCIVSSAVSYIAERSVTESENAGFQFPCGVLSSTKRRLLTFYQTEGGLTILETLFNLVVRAKKG